MKLWKKFKTNISDFSWKDLLVYVLLLLAAIGLITVVGVIMQLIFPEALIK